MSNYFYVYPLPVKILNCLSSNLSLLLYNLFLFVKTDLMNLKHRIGYSCSFVFLLSDKCINYINSNKQL